MLTAAHLEQAGPVAFIKAHPRSTHITYSILDQRYAEPVARLREPSMQGAGFVELVREYQASMANHDQGICIGAWARHVQAWGAAPTLVGYAWIDPARHELFEAHVLPDYQKYGILRNILEIWTRHNPSIKLELSVASDNLIVESAYEKLGFQVISTNKYGGKRMRQA